MPGMLLLIIEIKLQNGKTLDLVIIIGQIGKDSLAAMKEPLLPLCTTE